MRNNQIYELCKKIQPIYRSITGEGNRKTLNIFKKINPKLKIHFKVELKYLIESTKSLVYKRRLDKKLEI